MTDYNPELVKAWNEFADSPYGRLTPEEELPLWNSFKAGWEARFKHDLAMEKARDL